MQTNIVFRMTLGFKTTIYKKKHTTHKKVSHLYSEEEYFFEIAEAVFVGWFSFEYVVRLDILTFEKESHKLTLSKGCHINHADYHYHHFPGSSQPHTNQSKEWMSLISNLNELMKG